MLNLASVQAKIDRGEECGRALKDEIDTYIKSEPYRIIKQVSADFKRHGLALQIRRAHDFQRWAIIAGDAVHNLRCALDHLVYAIAVHELGSDPPPNERQTAFLINDRPEDFRSKFWRIKDLSTHVCKAIEDVQPYNRQHVSHPPLLALLRDFDDADKHRLLSIILTAVKSAYFYNLRNAPISKTYEIRSERGALQDGSEIASVLFERPAPYLDYDYSVSLSIAVPHASGPTGINMTPIETLVNDYLVPEVKAVVGIVSAVMQ